LKPKKGAGEGKNCLDWAHSGEIRLHHEERKMIPKGELRATQNKIGQWVREVVNENSGGKKTIKGLDQPPQGRNMRWREGEKRKVKKLQGG